MSVGSKLSIALTSRNMQSEDAFLKPMFNILAFNGGLYGGVGNDQLSVEEPGDVR